MNSDAQIRNRHGTALLEVRKSHICTEEAQRENISPYESQEKQRSDCG